jgi:hypothetical protein
MMTTCREIERVPADGSKADHGKPQNSPYTVARRRP